MLRFIGSLSDTTELHCSFTSSIKDIFLIMSTIFQEYTLFFNVHEIIH